jgi:hypothetical protein
MPGPGTGLRNTGLEREREKDAFCELQSLCGKTEKNIVEFKCCLWQVNGGTGELNKLPAELEN